MHDCIPAFLDDRYEADDVQQYIDKGVGVRRWCLSGRASSARMNKIPQSAIESTIREPLEKITREPATTKFC